MTSGKVFSIIALETYNVLVYKYLHKTLNIPKETISIRPIHLTFHVKIEV